MMRRYERRGHLAVRPEAFFDLFVQRPAAPENDLVGNVAVVSIEGPLTNHDEGWWDSYDAIKARVAKALESTARAVVMRINSPGGDAMGCCETSRALREMAAAAGKPLYAYADGMAASAAYALACAASKIAVPETGFVGSIGVIKSLASWSEADRMSGLDVRLVVSGARKGDGNPSQPISEGALAASQQEVDDLAAIFFGLVAESRGMSIDAVRGLEAAVLNGTRARAAGLADEVSTFEGLLASAGMSGDEPQKGQRTMDLKELVAELKQKAEGDGEEAEQAKKMLAALESEDDKGDDKGDDKPKPDGKAEGHEEPDGDEKKDPDAAAASATARRIAALEQSERKALLASRPDIKGSTRAWLEKAPIATVREAVESLERPKVPDLAAAVPGTGKVTPTRAEGQESAGASGRANRLPKAEADALDVQMGLKPASSGIRREGTRLVLGVMTPSQARAEFERRQKEG